MIFVSFLIFFSAVLLVFSFTWHSLVILLARQSQSLFVYSFSNFSRWSSPPVSCCWTFRFSQTLIRQASEFHLFPFIFVSFFPSHTDTICFSPESKRFTKIDEEAAQQLEELMGSQSLTRHEVYQQLIEAKNRPAGSLEEYFEKDLKVASTSISPSSTLPSITVTIAVPSISGQLIRDLLTSTATTTSAASASVEATSSSHYNRQFSHAVAQSSETFYLTSSLLHQLETYRKSVHINCLALVILGIRNSDPQNVQRDLALYSPHQSVLEMVSIFILSFLFFFLPLSSH